MSNRIFGRDTTNAGDVNGCFIQYVKPSFASRNWKYKRVLHQDIIYIGRMRKLKPREGYIRPRVEFLCILGELLLQ